MPIKPTDAVPSHHLLLSESGMQNPRIVPCSGTHSANIFHVKDAWVSMLSVSYEASCFRSISERSYEDSFAFRVRRPRARHVFCLEASPERGILHRASSMALHQTTSCKHPLYWNAVQNHQV